MKRHSLDIISLVFGIIFVGVALTGMFVDDDISVLEARWVWPALLIVAGAVILIFTVTKTPDPEPGRAEPYDPVD